MHIKYLKAPSFSCQACRRLSGQCEVRGAQASGRRCSAQCQSADWTVYGTAQMSVPQTGQSAVLLDLEVSLGVRVQVAEPGAQVLKAVALGVELGQAPFDLLAF